MIAQYTGEDEEKFECSSEKTVSYANLQNKLRICYKTANAQFILRIRRSQIFRSKTGSNATIRRRIPSSHQHSNSCECRVAFSTSPSYNRLAIHQPLASKGGHRRKTLLAMNEIEWRRQITVSPEYSDENRMREHSNDHFWWRKNQNQLNDKCILTK